jgi:hypothetical protein
MLCQLVLLFKHTLIYKAYGISGLKLVKAVDTIAVLSQLSAQSTIDNSASILMIPLTSLKLNMTLDDRYILCFIV